METTAYISVVMPDGTEIDDVKVEVEFDATYQSAYISGPPEDCYPADGTLTITKLIVEDGYDDGETKFDAQAIELQVIATCLDKLQDKCWDEYHDQRNSGDQEYSED